MVSASHFRAWMANRQGLCGPRTWSPREALAKSGWSRSVGGANPYLAIFARTGVSREEMDRLATNLEIFELPSARGCTYVVPKEHFELALLSGAPFRNVEIAVAKKLGVSDEELDRLASRVLEAFAGEALEPSEIKDRVGDAVRNLGEEGKKKGITTTLPPVLGRLQSQGLIRRQPVNGRFDTQKYRYELWRDGPLEGISKSPEETAFELARAYFQWTGAASVAHFVWFSAYSVKMAKAAIALLDLRTIPDTDLLITAEDYDSLLGFRAPSQPDFRLVGCMDNSLHLRREVTPLLDAEDVGRTMTGERGTVELRTVVDLTHHAILDRGRLVGLWDYDPSGQIIRWSSFVEPTLDMRAAVSEMEGFVRDQLGDARSFSLDSPESRKKRLATLPQTL